MQFKLEINLDNAAYEDLGWELGDNIEHVLGRIGQGVREGKVYDTNGNNVGQWSIKEEVLS